MPFFNFIEVQYKNLNEQIKNWLKGVYNKSDINFTPASPHGMILSNLQEFFQHTLLYLKNSVNQINIQTTFNKKAVRSISRIAGHNPSRSISATGVIKLLLKSNVNLVDEIGGNNITIQNETVLKNENNGLFYTILTNEQFSTYSFSDKKQIYLNVIQGKYKTTSFTGDGTENQSFSINAANNEEIDNFEVYITYNGFSVEKKEHLYDMLPNSYQCYTRTGFNGGVDIYFGNINNGFIPENGTKITVKYLMTNGSDGNIENDSLANFKFIDDVTSNDGNVISVDDYFDIELHKDINFSSDGETVTFTKNILPYVSRNFVLATPDQFIYHLRRLNMFSKVNAYNVLDDHDTFKKNQIIDDLKGEIQNNITNDIKREDLLNKINYLENLNITNDNKMFLYLIPDIRKYFSATVNYFNVPFDVFYLDDNEKTKIMDYLKKMGILMLTSDVDIVQPDITKYIMNVYVRRYSDTVEENLRQEIINVVSDYFINNERFDRIIKSDIIRSIKNLSGVDSVDVYFLSERNERYHEQGKLLQNDTPVILEKPIKIKNQQVYELKDYDKNLVIGLDKIMGDIVIEKKELPVIRGGWRDRNGIFYNETPEEQGLGPINIIFNGVTKRSV